MKPMRFSSVLSGLGALLLVAAACGPAPAAAPAKPAGAPPAVAPSGASSAPAAAPAQPAAAALQQIVDGAKREPTIKAQWSSSSFGGAAGFNEIIAGVNK